MRYSIHRLSCFDAQVTGLTKVGQDAVKATLEKMRTGDAARDTIDDEGVIKKILAGTGVQRTQIGPGILEFTITSHWRIFAYKTGAWTKVAKTPSDKFGKPLPNVEATKTVYDGTYWPVKIGHLESGRCVEPSNALT